MALRQTIIKDPSLVYCSYLITKPAYLTKITNLSIPFKYRKANDKKREIGASQMFKRK
jgi:hypothetical protein